MFYRLRTLALLMAALAPGIVLSGCGGGDRQATDGPGAAVSAMGGMDRDMAKAAAPDTGAAEPRAAPHQIVIDNFAFQPAKLTVAAGTKVTWVNRDDVPHTATSTQKPRAFDSGALDTDDTFAHVFTVPGTYEYFCAVHPHMTAQIIVK